MKKIHWRVVKSRIVRNLRKPIKAFTRKEPLELVPSYNPRGPCFVIVEVDNGDLRESVWLRWSLQDPPLLQVNQLV